MVLILRILPDPVAFFPVNRTALGENDLSAIVRLIPTDRIENELPVGFPPIMQRLTVDDVMRQLRDESWRESVEHFWKFTMREPVAFQRAGNAG